ncbi:MAG: hypothetical protein ACSHXF_11565 [Aquaticitalea sp.]
MATKNKTTNASLIDSTAKQALVLSTKANDFALKSTETVLNKSLELASIGFSFSNSIVKKGLQLTAKQQDSVFNVLESAKNKLAKKSK